jgi:hypothetical protein
MEIELAPYELAREELGKCRLAVADVAVRPLLRLEYWLLLT